MREKKRDTANEFTFRDVFLHPQLADITRDWFASPGHKGQYTICDADGGRTTVRSGKADRELEKTLRGSRWSILPGWHCLRHTFASILASKGVDQRVIDKLMGHLDAKTVARYRHLHRDTTQEAILRLLQ